MIKYAKYKFWFLSEYVDKIHLIASNGIMDFPTTNMKYADGLWSSCEIELSGDELLMLKISIPRLEFYD